MSEKKTMTRAEKLDALKCVTKVMEVYGRKTKTACENCAYIDFCFDMIKFFTEMTAEKYA